MLALAAVKLPALLAWIRSVLRLMAPADALILLWLIPSAPTLEEPAVEVADRLIVSFAKLTVVPASEVWPIVTEPAVIAAPVNETLSVPKLIVPPAVRLLWVIPLAEVSVSVPTADILMALVPLVMLPVALRLV